MYDDNLKDFITNTQKCLSDIASVGINVEEEILAFSILTKLPDKFHSLIEKVTLNSDTQGNPNAILNVLHEATLKKEALLTDTTRALILKKDSFPSKIIHYCSNGKHNPLVTTHKPEKSKNTLEMKIKNILTDGGGEFVNISFRNHCAESGINHIISPPYTPQHNPFAERGNQSILEKARCILLQSQLPIKFWAEAISTATFLCNLSPKHENQKTPYEIWHNSKPPLHKLNPFGFFDKEIFPPLPSQKQFTEYIVRIFPNPIQTTEEFPTDSNTEEDSSSSESNSVDNEEEDTYVDGLEHQPKRICVIGPRNPTLISSKIDSNNILPFPQRQARANITSVNPNPKTSSEAMISPNREDWDLAIKRELQNMKKLDVWTLRNKKDVDHPIARTCVFKRKIDNTGKTIEYKACLCAHGFHQIAGLDYQSTFAPTGRLSSLRALISFTTINRYNFHQMDVRSAFLYAQLQEEICLEIAQGVL
ncbi:hypothetical protein O181_027047 [Austropuccinia psidii MF-1]|uniref:Integrase catalytic domain-containing protein n=1 Tax=Austropuccinia psidii MF-1 TaxID=1389203 RepID=A0A9Q3H1B5_9BASI|nr:hypothetical protein [Austropuccinia psidii MF-1]